MWYFVVFVTALVFSAFVSPKPPSVGNSAAKSPTVPSATEGRAIAVLFGTRVLSGPNVVWYGNFSSAAVKKKSKGKK